jgi:hypothetical protein
MRRLLTIELFKLKQSKSAKVLSIIYFVLFTFTALIASINFDFGSINFRIADQGIFNFPYIWHFNTYIVAIIKILLAIVIISMITSEYSNRTLKQNLIDGLSKKEFILSKFYTIVALSLASTLLVFIVSLILGLIFSDYNEIGIIFSDLEYILAYFIKLVSFFSLCMFLAFLVRKSAFTLGFIFLVYLAESILTGIIVFKAEDLNFIIDYFPLNSMANLIVEPFTRLGIVKAATTQINPEFVKEYNVSFLKLIIPTVWTFIFVWGSYKILKKRDL